jgi:branched-chain amino acid transport system ATP-binding protein
VIEVRALTAGYGRLTILHEVTLTVGRGEIVALIGPNGAGKSTVLKAVYGLCRIRSGQVTLDGRDVTGRPPRALLGLGLAYIPQGRNVFSELTVRENLLLAAEALGHRAAAGVDDAFRRFPALRAHLDQPAGLLSGGQQQMVALSRALIGRPRALLVDEPSLGLAPNVRREVFQALATIAAEGVAILLVEQNAGEALAVADRAYVLESGQVRHEGRGRDLLADPSVRRIYLGEAAFRRPERRGAPEEPTPPPTIQTS